MCTDIQDVLTFQNACTLVLALATVFCTLLTWRIVIHHNAQVSLLRDQAHAQKTQAELESFMLIAKLMEETRSDREIVRWHVERKMTWMDMKTDNTLEQLDKVCRAFDILGLLDRNNLINQDLVDRFYAPPLVNLWDAIMGSYVDELRKAENRGKTHFWELDQLYHRIQNVPKVHPGITGKADWPEHPRQTSNFLK